MQYEPRECFERLAAELDVLVAITGAEVSEFETDRPAHVRLLGVVGAREPR